jgi:RNA binding exosome subunit
MNLDELEPYEALDVLENMLEQELTTHQRIEEVREHFKERLRTYICNERKRCIPTRFNFNCYYHIKIEKRNREVERRD